MDFLELAENRYSVRAFLPNKVEQNLIDDILKSAQLAPTAKNNQPHKIYVLQSEDALNKVKEVTNCTYGAPLVFLICQDTNESWKSPYEDNYSSGEMDASIVCTHMMLTAQDIGLGSVWVLLFDKQKTSEIFNLPENIKPVCLLPVGYPSDKAAPSPRHSETKSLDEMVKYL
jgi:nitroreductase